jgi:ataxia telangiectasia mutated family protein
MDLLRTTLGLKRMHMPPVDSITCGPVAQAWQQHLLTQEVVRYLLLLDGSPFATNFKACPSCPSYSGANEALFVLDNINFQSTQKLILELLSPKVSDLLDSWKSHRVDRSSAMSIDTFRRVLHACIAMLLLISHYNDSTFSQSSTLEENISSLAEEVTDFVREMDMKESRGSQVFLDTLLQVVRPYIPACGLENFLGLFKRSPQLLQFLKSIARELQRRNVDGSVSLAINDDMDIDEDFAVQKSQAGNDGPTVQIPRCDMALEMSVVSFLTTTRARLNLIANFPDEASLHSGIIPSEFITYLLKMKDEELLSCRWLLQELLESDLTIYSEDAARLVEHFGNFLSSNEWSRSEIMHGICLDVLFGLGTLWTQAEEGSELGEVSIQVYGWFIKSCLGGKIASPAVQKRIARLLLLLLRVDPDDLVSLSVSKSMGTSHTSHRTSLIGILQSGNASVKFYIGNKLPDYFELIILKDHETLFLDILDNLPNNPDWIEGIAFRLFVFARLASRWSNLLRRCIYHIFETPPSIPNCTKHATRCMLDVSSALPVDGPRELFTLFAPQILYTWLHDKEISELPFEVFGYSSVEALLKGSRQVAVGLMVMRGQEETVDYLATLLETTETELVKNCFAVVMAYSIAFSMSVPPKQGSSRVSGEIWVKKLLPDKFLECINLHFAEIVSYFFNIIDDSELEKYLLKSEKLLRAGQILKKIKSINSSDVVLPPNQQPVFKAKYLAAWIHHLCEKSAIQMEYMYIPAMVVSIARFLLNNIHSALGSLHACSVLRKLRILISLAGDAALCGYPLEMLLQSISTFLIDAECVEDALGLIQYLLLYGKVYLEQNPSFLAGITLSVLGSLRVFVQLRQASTTQDTQHKISVSKAEAFHRWMGGHISKYDPPMLQDQSKAKFHSLVQSACKIGLIGNAEVGTHESDLLSSLLKDEQIGESILTQPSRELAMAMLCYEFQIPKSFRTDVLGSHAHSVSHAAAVWKSCKGHSVGKQYLSWAGRVLGRAFAVSGHVHEELLRESSLSQIRQFSKSLEEEVEDYSQACLLKLLEALTLNPDRRTVGLAEVALRLIISNAEPTLRNTCHRNISGSLIEASDWGDYGIPPSEREPNIDDIETIGNPLTKDAINRPTWLCNLAIKLARDVSQDPVLRALIPILQGIPSFAERAFPFILHLVLSMPSASQQKLRKEASSAFNGWFKNSEAVDKTKLKLLINSILYLRTQPLLNERSKADRSRWLDIDYFCAAAAATRCGMFKTALLFVEESGSTQVVPKPTRRSSAIHQEAHEPLAEMLLTIFQNIDDPDLFYGVQQTPNLSTILSRLEYEKDGPKGLAFRGAQYDSHIRTKDPESSYNAQSLVKALDLLSLSGLSHSLLQSQQTIGMSNTSLESMFRTARKLEQWDIPVPSNYSNDTLTIYKAFQAVQNAPDYPAMLNTLNEGFDATMSRLVHEDLGASALHGALQTLATLTELDEVIGSRGSVEFEEIFLRFKERSGWMKTGRFV